MKFKRHLSLLTMTAVLSLSMAPSAFAAGGFLDALQDNKKRRIAVETIADALYGYYVDNGNYPTHITTTATNIGDAGWDADVCADIVPTYLPFVGWDPDFGSYTSCVSYDSGITVSMNSAGTSITVSAPYAELGAVITTTR